MSSRRLSFRSRTRVQRKSKQLARKKTSQAQQSTTGALVFFLLVFLVLLGVLLHARVSWNQLVLGGIALVVLIVCLISVWIVRRNQAYTVLKPVREPVFSVPQIVLPASRTVTVADLLQLTPGEFENFVGDLLEVTGQYTEVRRIGGAGDRGADLLAKDRFGRPFIVQCKRYHPGHKVSAGEVRNFLGAKGIYGADECLFVTTSKFTDAARTNIIQFRHTVFLWDGEKLLQMIQEYWDVLPARWK